MKHHTSILLLIIILALNVNFITPKINFSVINTWPFQIACQRALDLLKLNKSSLDAVEFGCNMCEQYQCDGSVGFGSN